MTKIYNNTKIYSSTRVYAARNALTALDPLTIVSSVSPAFFVSADVGVSIVTGVSQWNDQSGNNRHAVQATTGNQPAYNAAGLNSHGIITFDGSNDYLNFSTYTAPAPGTTPSWYWMVFNPITALNGAYFMSAGGTTKHRFYWNGTAAVAMNNGSAGNSTATTANNWYRGEIFLNSSTTDYIKIGSTKVTGSNTGNSLGATNIFTIGSNAGTNPSNTAFACFGCWQAEPTTPEKAALDAWAQAYYSASVNI